MWEAKFRHQFWCCLSLICNSIKYVITQDRKTVSLETKCYCLLNLIYHISWDCAFLQCFTFNRVSILIVIRDKKVEWNSTWHFCFHRKWFVCFLVDKNLVWSTNLREIEKFRTTHRRHNSYLNIAAFAWQNK